MSGTAGRAKEHAPEEWERIKRPFCDLYHKQKKTLSEVRQTLKDEQNFDATERQYKRKIKLWNLRKNANVGDYSHIDQLMQSPSKVPLSDVFMSRGIPITDDKIRRYVRHKGKKVPAAAARQLSPPPDTHPWSPSTADKTTPEPDIERLKSKYMQLVDKYMLLHDELANLKLIVESCSAKLSYTLARDAAERQDSFDWGTHVSPQRTTQQQPRAQPHFHTHTSQQPEKCKSRGYITPQQATAAAPAPAPEILAVREANAKMSWRTVTINGADRLGDLQQPYHREPNPFEDSFREAVQPDRAMAHAHLSIDDLFGRGPYRDMPPPAGPVDGKARRKDLLIRQFQTLYREVKSSLAADTATASEPDDPHRGMGRFSVGWMPTPIPPIRTGLTPGATGNMWSPILR